MIVVADASPLIFLGKIGRLRLVVGLFPGTILVPMSVNAEVLAIPLAPDEEHSLNTFLKSCRIVSVSAPRRYTAALSQADNEALTLSVQRKAGLLLADDRLLRRLAVAEGIRPMGTLGILLRAKEQGLMTGVEARKCLEQLVQQHQFRISIEVYDATVQRIEAHRAPGK
jgi:predicted nucleic acid-binding protein